MRVRTSEIRNQAGESSGKDPNSVSDETELLLPSAEKDWGDPRGRNDCGSIKVADKAPTADAEMDAHFRAG